MIVEKFDRFHEKFKFKLFNGYFVIEGNCIREFFCEIAFTSKNYFKYSFSKYQTIFNIFKYHLECMIDKPFVWDIPELLIQYTDEIINKKEVLSSEDFRDGTFVCIFTYFNARSILVPSAKSRHALILRFVQVLVHFTHLYCYCTSETSRKTIG